MMSLPYLRNELLRTDHVITDFAQTFERQTLLPMTLCREIVQDSNSIFHSFSYLIQHLFSLIDSVIPCQTFIIKGLTVPQRKDFYTELSQIGIHFTKYRFLDHNRNLCTDICIYTSFCWSVPDYRTNPELAIYQHHINFFNAFYSHIDNLVTTQTSTNGNIIVSLENFLKFKRIFADALSSYNNNNSYINYNNINNNNYIINNIVYNISNLSSVTNTHPQPTHSKPSISSNTIIKHQLADLIFDIKDNLTDAMYKEILEKISLISS